jgi:hypothetical protein
VTRASPAQAGNFAAGDYLYLRTGQLTNNPTTGWPEPDAETFRVISANPTTGAIPLSRTFAQEYYPAAGGGVSSTSATAFPAP